MAKFSSENRTTVKIPLSSLKESGNVRKEYDSEEIENLAKSIQQNGLLNPITVKPGKENEDGALVYEVICGHRRIRALKYLQEKGVDTGLVECCIRTGDTWTLQMIENIQRTDLSALEKEKAIVEMLDKGYSQSEIADLISKPLSYVSDIIAGTKVRQTAENAGVDTSELKTRALAQLRSIDSKKLPEKIEKLSSQGGTVKAATEIMHEYKQEQEEKENSLDIAFEEDEEAPTTHVSSEPNIPDTTLIKDRGDFLTKKDLAAQIKFLPDDTPVCFYSNSTKNMVGLKVFKFENLSEMHGGQRVSGDKKVFYRIVLEG